MAAAAATVAHGQWATSFVNETSTRLVMSPSLQNDNLEKDFSWGDFDQDGDTDLVVARKFPGSIQGGFPNILLMNEGGILVDRTQEFGTASDVPGDLGLKANTNDREIEAGDVNGDGWLDLVTATTMSDSLSALLGQPRVYINLGDDIDGNWLGFRFEDARIPVLVAKNGSAANPRFCESVLVDLTGDGFPDIFFTDYDTPETSGTVCIDLNGDGDTGDPGECQGSPGETASKDYDNKFLVNWGNDPAGPGPGYFFDSTNTRFTSSQLVSAFGSAADYGDFNGDGITDVVRINTLTGGQNVGIFYGKLPPLTGLSFTGPDVVATNAPYAVSKGDLNNDGKLDLVITDDGQDRYLLNSGNGADGLANFTTTIIADSLNEFGNTIKIADLDNDGKLDVMIADVDGDLPPFCPTTGRRAHFYRNNGTPGTTSYLDEVGTIIPTASLGATYDFAPFDINGDGWLDVVIGRCAGIEIWMNHPPLGIAYAYGSGHPNTVDAGTPTNFDVTVSVVGGGPIVDGTLKLNYRVDAGAWQQSDLVGGPSLYTASLPAIDCGETLDYYVSGVLSSNGFTYSDPAAAPAAFFTAYPITGTELVYSTEFENGTEGWTTNGVAQNLGGWALGDPVGTSVGGVPANPENDNTANPGVNCWVTGNGTVGGAASASDVDATAVILTSPAFVVTQGSLITCNYYAWKYTEDAANPTQLDYAKISYSFDGGTTWILARQIATTNSTWQAFSDTVGPATGSSFMMKLDDVDIGNTSTEELAIDTLSLTQTVCATKTPCPVDLNADGSVDASDLAILLGAWGTAGPGDLDVSGNVDAADLAILLGGWGACP